MDASKLEQFENKRYLNIETFRKNGEGVKTPVWFLRDGDTLYIRTMIISWKVKRIRNNPRVRIAACTASGEVLGDWVDGRAEVLTGEAAEGILRLYRKKYGFQYSLFEFLLALRRGGWVTVAIS
jgi:uncharacterized protein